ncbi:hypothetical protein FJ936_20970 [Mesorhizobium sp. B2-4-13]|uniref:hypothetical protein n=1 Tax=Mesorhizobium sp. B2-4-13 TaxID=2589936 RepID=UPI001153CAE2|nr:hypothetical protein [Mesorhizobium sp. B2-4-13]TPK83412.1 hypothetical protein FJ936_20970 [Mesorhizobium sp. B2-4-13]
MDVDDLIDAVKASPKRARLGIAIATMAIVAAVAGVGVALKGAIHDEPQLPAVDIGQILHPGVT